MGNPRYVPTSSKKVYSEIMNAPTVIEHLRQRAMAIARAADPLSRPLIYEHTGAVRAHVLVTVLCRRGTEADKALIAAISAARD